MEERGLLEWLRREPDLGVSVYSYIYIHATVLLYLRSIDEYLYTFLKKEGGNCSPSQLPPPLATHLTCTCMYICFILCAIRV